MLDDKEKLRRLMEKRAEINRQIEELKNGTASIDTGLARYEIKTYVGRKEYRIVARYVNQYSKMPIRHVPVLVADSREDIRVKLVQFIADLVELNERMVQRDGHADGNSDGQVHQES